MDYIAVPIKIATPSFRYNIVIDPRCVRSTIADARRNILLSDLDYVRALIRLTKKPYFPGVK
ncbi:MAG: hypothetical protein IJL93_04410 [Bacteroidales bacterium]|nr:hypothetical protein [Bacteroidales bacterium]